MKKLVLLLLTTLALVSCDDVMIQKYTRVHIQMEGGVPIHCEVLNWNSISSSKNPVYEIQTQEYGWVLVSSENFILYKADKCPICNR